MELTTDEKSFLKEYEVPHIWMSAASERIDPAECEDEGPYFIYGGEPCRFGHSLQTLKNHNCIQCTPANIQTVVNRRKNGTLFIAKSSELSLLKIGVIYGSADSDGVHRRGFSINWLNEVGYACADDWKVRYSVIAYYTGQLEMRFHKKMERHARSSDYLSDLTLKKAIGLYRCSLSEALDTLWPLLDSGQQERVWQYK